LLQRGVFVRKKKLELEEKKNVWFEVHAIAYNSSIEMKHYPINSMQLQNRRRLSVGRQGTNQLLKSPVSQF